MMDESLLQQFSKYFTAPVQIICLIAVAYAIKKIFFKPKEEEPEPEPQEQLEKMKKRDFTLEELKIYDGKISKDYDGQRILIGVNSKVFDVTRGRHFYGPEGPYGVFAGKDASRGLATFSVDGAVLKEEYDDLSDLNSMQLDSLREWEMQFTERYDYIGRLLKPGEKARNYDQESETEDDESKSSQKKND